MKLEVILLAAIMAAYVPSARAQITNGLGGHWTFDEANGLILHDSTTNADNGTLSAPGASFPTDNSMWVTGQIGGALHFRGPNSGDFVVVTNYPKPTSTMSLSIWAY